MTSARPTIILDCDPGHDDAVAIVLAAHLCDVLGITTVAGNAPLERTTYNARVMRHLLNRDTEVHSGADAPLGVPAAAPGYVHGESDQTASAPLTDPVHPGEVLATIYHGFGIDPETIVFNHLNQPRELVKAEAVTSLYG